MKTATLWKENRTPISLSLRAPIRQARRAGYFLAWPLAGAARALALLRPLLRYPEIRRQVAPGRLPQAENEWRPAPWQSRAF